MVVFIPPVGWLRPGISVGLLLVLAGLEALWPRRVRAVPRGLRWPGNLGLALLGGLAVKLVLPLAALGVAVLAGQHCWGLLNMLALPPGVKFVLALLVLDVAIFTQHRLFHAIPVLWRLHRVHHADVDLDVTSGARFHPLEILLSMVIKMLVVLALGVPPGAVLVFEILLNAGSMFNHSNLALPVGLDKILRLLLVTPDMHRVHHSVVRVETDSNFGFSLSWWDWIFGTYRAEPALGQKEMVTGIELFREPHASRLDALLVQPFRTPPFE